MYVLVLGSKHCIWFMIITHNCNPIITGIENSLFSSIDDYHPVGLGIFKDGPLQRCTVTGAPLIGAPRIPENHNYSLSFIKKTTI